MPAHLDRAIEGCQFLSNVLEATATFTEATDLTELGTAVALEGIGVKLIAASAATLPAPIVSVPLGVAGGLFLTGGIVSGGLWTAKQASKLSGGPKVPSLLSKDAEKSVKLYNKSLGDVPKGAGVPIGKGITPGIPSSRNQLIAKEKLDTACEWLKKRAAVAEAAKSIELPGVDFKFPVRVDLDHGRTKAPSGATSNGPADQGGGGGDGPGDGPDTHGDGPDDGPDGPGGGHGQ